MNYIKLLLLVIPMGMFQYYASGQSVDIEFYWGHEEHTFTIKGNNRPSINEVDFYVMIRGAEGVFKEVFYPVDGKLNIDLENLDLKSGKIDLIIRSYEMASTAIREIDLTSSHKIRLPLFQHFDAINCWNVKTKHRYIRKYESIIHSIRQKAKSKPLCVVNNQLVPLIWNDDERQLELTVNNI